MGHPFNPKRAEALERIAQAAKAAGRAGMCLDELLALGLPFDRVHVNQLALLLMRRGTLHRAGKNRKGKALRFFSEAEFAHAHELTLAGDKLAPSGRKARTAVLPRDRHADVMAGYLEGKRRLNEQQAELRAHNRALSNDAPLNITERTVVTKKPKYPDHRYAVTGQVHGGFRTMGAGAYETEPSGWAAAAIASRAS